MKTRQLDPIRAISLDGNSDLELLEELFQLFPACDPETDALNTYDRVGRMFRLRQLKV